MNTAIVIPIGEFIEKQRELDHIIQTNHPHVNQVGGYIEQTRLIERISACAVEVGEAMNEWRKFKYWSTKQESRTDALYEELADVYHFILGLYPIIEPNISYQHIVHKYTPSVAKNIDVSNACRVWLRLYENVLQLAHVIEDDDLYGIFSNPMPKNEAERHYGATSAWFETLNCFYDVLSLVEMPYATLEASYNEKYNENIERQEQAY